MQREINRDLNKISVADYCVSLNIVTYLRMMEAYFLISLIEVAFITIFKTTQVQEKYVPCLELYLPGKLSLTKNILTFLQHI